MLKEKKLYLPNVFFSLLSRFFFKNRPIFKKKPKIIVYQVGNIGDLIVSTPVYRELRKEFADAEITLLSSSGSKKFIGADEIIKPLNCIDKIQTFFLEDFSSWRHYYHFFRSIQKEKYDLIVYLPANLWTTFHVFRDMVFFFLTGIRHGVGFQVFEDYYSYLKYNIPPRNETERLLDLLKPLGIKNGNKKLEFTVSNENIEFIQNYLSKNEIAKNKVIIAVMPGGKYPSRLWPKQYFINLIDRINDNFSVNIILVGSESEKKLTEEIINQTKTKPFNSAGNLNIHSLGALIQQCRLLITNDTGPMHIAAAVGTPTVSIFSSVDIPFLWYPAGNGNKVFYNKVDCSPCFQQKCDNHICMEGISAESVYQAVEKQFLKFGIQKREKA